MTTTRKHFFYRLKGNATPLQGSVPQRSDQLIRFKEPSHRFEATSLSHRFEAASLDVAELKEYE